MAIPHRLTTSEKRVVSLLAAVMILSTTGLSGLGACACLHTPDESVTPSLSAPAQRASCCDRCGPDHGSCSSSDDPGDEDRDVRYTPPPRSVDRHPSALQPASGVTLPIESGPRLRCPPPAPGLLRVPPHLSTTILLI